MAGFTAGGQGADGDVEARVGAGARNIRHSMTILTEGQVLFRGPAMGCRRPVAAVDGVGSGARSAGMTGGGTVVRVSVIGRKTAWCCG